MQRRRASGEAEGDQEAPAGRVEAWCARSRLSPGGAWPPGAEALGETNDRVTSRVTPEQQRREEDEERRKRDQDLRHRSSKLPQLRMPADVPVPAPPYGW